MSAFGSEANVAQVHEDHCLRCSGGAARAVILEDRASATIERSCVRQSSRTHLVVQVVGEILRAVRAWAALRRTLHEGVAQWPPELSQ